MENIVFAIVIDRLGQALQSIVCDYVLPLVGLQNAGHSRPKILSLPDLTFSGSWRPSHSILLILHVSYLST